MSSLPITKLTAEQYLAQERRAEFRSEFYRGEMFAMAGASRAHNVISGNIFAKFHNQFNDRDCEVYQGDMRVKVRATGLYVYPDVVVACENPKFEDKELDTLLNPRVLCEVLSNSTERYDRGTKWRHYQSLPSLRDYLLVSSSAAFVERFTRTNEDHWIYAAYEGEHCTIDIESISCQLDLKEIYAKVVFEPESEEEQAST